ncbi:histidine phosphatase family protein [Hazenella sp. IB182353]|uniref:histidine phosphatase family protein n=1 Tax=Polycladospora coralii TaxID=2771432 RepID=UPI001746684D|nr:histidine phosphatase family protein [Polycladospora coralii]
MIRHAPVEVDPDQPAAEWKCSEVGKKLTLELIDSVRWEDIHVIYHSPEIKAQQTAKIIANELGVRMYVRTSLREVEARIGFLPINQFIARVGDYLEGYPDPDFEDYDQAVARFHQSICEIVSAAIVSHGRILTAWYSYLLGSRLSRKDWQSIGLPDLSVVHTDTWQVKQGFFAEL